MKKLALVLAFILSMSLFGCGSWSKTEEANDPVNVEVDGEGLTPEEMIVLIEGTTGELIDAEYDKESNLFAVTPKGDYAEAIKSMEGGSEDQAIQEEWNKGLDEMKKLSVSIHELYEPNTILMVKNPLPGNEAHMILINGQVMYNALEQDVKVQVPSSDTSDEEKEPEEATDLAKDVPREYKNALAKAESYSSMMHMSKQGIYDQLTSEYGEKFTPEAAQYAVDNLDVDWNLNALEKAKSYQEVMNMSNAAIYDQLISEYGEKFTPEQAQYAVDNLPQ